MSPNALTRQYEHLTPWEQVRLRLAAQARKDAVEEKRLFDATSLRELSIPLHLQTEMALHTFSLIHVTEQLESLACYYFAAAQLDVDFEDCGLASDFVRVLAGHARRFRINREGWRRFCASVGIDGDALVAGNYQGAMLTIFGKGMFVFPPKVEAIFKGLGVEPETPEDVDADYRSWRRLLEKATRDPPCLKVEGP